MMSPYSVPIGGQIGPAKVGEPTLRPSFRFPTHDTPATHAPASAWKMTRLASVERNSDGCVDEMRMLAVAKCQVMAILRQNFRPDCLALGRGFFMPILRDGLRQGSNVRDRADSQVGKQVEANCGCVLIHESCSEVSCASQPANRRIGGPDRYPACNR
jgi:hypothetical protein